MVLNVERIWHQIISIPEVRKADCIRHPYAPFVIDCSHPFFWLYPEKPKSHAVEQKGAEHR
jgi:hypothetical protein